MKSASFLAHTVMQRFALGLLGTLAFTTLGLACGVQEHLKTNTASGSGGNTPASGTGGAVQQPGTGGQGTASGGVSGGSGGVTSTGGTGSGGSVGTGGNSIGTGGNTVGTGGNTVGTGGSTAGSGGRIGSGGTVGTGGITGTGGGTASGITINIAGTVVPKEKAIVYIHFGHSNMQGQATLPAATRPFFYDTQPQLWVYRGANTFVLAKEPTAPSRSTDTKAGPGTAILKTAAAAAPTDYHFISIGRGEGSAPSPDYLKANNLLYPTVMTRAMELKGKVTFGAIFVMLGITERHLPAADQPGFPARMKQIIADMRADLGEPNLPVLACDYEMEATGTLSPTSAVGLAAIPMIRSLPGMITNLELVPTVGLGMMDDHHFNFDGHKLWAERGIMIMQTKGWFPWRR